MNRISGRVFFLTAFIFFTACSAPSQRVSREDLPAESALLDPTSTPFKPVLPTARIPDREITLDDQDSPSRLYSALTTFIGQQYFAYSQQDLLPFAREILEGLNRQRDASGIAPLKGSPDLDRLAYLRAQDMIARGFLGATDPDSGLPLTRSLLIAAGYEGKIAESIFATTGPLEKVPAAALEQWLSSPEHRSNVLDPEFSGTGVGLMGDETWWKIVVIFVANAQ